MKDGALPDLQQALLSRVGREAALDPYTRALYSTDASNHRITPLGVFFPRDVDEIQAAVELAAERGIPLLPRGSGTSLGGQAVGAALILDCSRHMNRIHEIDPEVGRATVDPGVVCQTLNAQTAKVGRMYGPDPASADRATFGGMIGNNATGAHSIRYGMSADHLVECEAVLSDGTRTTFGPMGEAEAAAKSRGRGIEADAYRTALALRATHGPAVRQAWPRTWRRASGYGLNYLLGFSPTAPPAWYAAPAPYPPAEGVNLAPLLCGSEGTLAIIGRATVRLVEKPAATVLVVLAFDSVAEACEETPGLLETGPAAVELLPRTVLQQARQVPAYARKLGFVDGDPAALLVVEYTGDSPSQARAAANGVSRRGRILADPEAQADLWAVRKVGLGLLMSVPGDRKPITFIEDVAVPVERLGEYVREVDRILAAHGTYGEWYAHASAGCLHLRPLINLKAADGVARMRAIADQIVSLVMWMKGSLSGEHGDGLSHTEFNSALFGPKVIEAFRAVKNAFDPQGLLNPGKVVPLEEGAPGRAAVDADLRYGADYRADSPATTFAFAREGGFAGAVEACNGAGVCRKDGGVMCPSFQATRDETHSTRGRANALRAALSGVLPAGSLTGLQMHQVLDLCLECKGCKAECPTSVDMARVKAEFLAMHQSEYGVPLRSLFFGEARRLGSVAQRFARLVNAFNRSQTGKAALRRVLGIAPERRLPEYAERTFLDHWRGRAFSMEGEPVVLFVDSFTNFHHPEVGVAAVEVLEAAGFQVQVETRQACCGRTMISKGLLDRAKRVAERNLEQLDRLAGEGRHIVGLEPSCLLTLRDEYLDFFPGDPRAQRVARSSLLIEELLTEGEAGRRPIDRLKWEAGDGPIYLHGHCHAKSLVGSAPVLAMLRAVGRPVHEIDSGCCGMAGSFGYEAEHYELSMQIGGLKLFPAVKEAEAKGATVVAAGFSCRSQIRDGTGVVARHPIEVLAEALAKRPG